METDELTKTVAEKLSQLAEIVGGKAWGADKGNPRIYMPSRKGAKAFFYFPDFPTGCADDLLGGACFKVFIEECGQHPNWYVSQRREIAARFQAAALALDAAHAGDMALAAEIMEAGVAGCDIDEVAGHLANGRLEEARQALGL